MATKKNKELAKKYLDRTLRGDNMSNLEFETDDEGRLIVNEFGEKTTLKTDGIKFFTFEKAFTHLDSVLLYVMSDTHVASEEANVTKIERYIKQIHDDPRGVLALNGDLINFAIKDSVSDPYTQKLTILESIQRIQDMVEEMDSEGRIVANLWGNHDGNRSQKLVAITPVTQYVNKKTAKLTSPAIAVIKLKLKSKFSENELVDLNIMLQHGEAAKGGALGTVQSAIQLAVDIYNAVPDIVAMGHTHQNAGSSSIVFMPDLKSPKAQRALRLQKRIETVKKRISGYAVSAGITTEVYALKKGYPLANTDAMAIETIQVKDKDSYYWDTNAVDLNQIYALKNMIRDKDKKKLVSAQMQLDKEERKYNRSVEKLNIEEHAKALEKYKANLQTLVADTIGRYGIGDELEKRMEKKTNK